MAVPHPTEHSQDLDRWSEIHEQRNDDASWHYRMRLPPGFVLGSGSTEPPRPGGCQLLGQYQHDSIRYQVLGYCLQREVDPKHWLQRVLELDGWRALSTWSQRDAGGWSGDIVASKGAEVARFLAIKHGASMFLAVAVASAEHFEEKADRIFAVLASLRPARGADSNGLAELVQAVALEVPQIQGRRFYVPDSWRVILDPPGDQMVGFQALHVAGYELDGLHGRIACALAIREVAKRPREAAELFLQPLREHQFRFEHEDFSPEEAPPGFRRSWLCVTESFHAAMRGEMRCRVMLHEDFWLIAGMIGVHREDGFWSWAANARGLDVVTLLAEACASKEV